jgi:nitroreductase
MTKMDALENIMTRRSVRSFTDQPISDQDLETILRAGMAGPCCVNARDWQFLVTRDRAVLNEMADGNGGPADPLRGAALGILVLGDLDRAFPPAKDYWIIDGAIAAQNMVLAAHALGIGSVWLGTYPQMERVEAQRAHFGLPDAVVPHSLLAFGYPASGGPKRPNRGAAPGSYTPELVHVDRW